MEDNHDDNNEVEIPPHIRRQDDMLNRRLGNMPSVLRQKKIEQHNQFITPTGDPLTYMKQHKSLSKSTSNLTESTSREQEEINSRYEKLQSLKQQMRDEEDTWTSKLSAWKSRRRSVTSTLRERKDEREISERTFTSRGGEGGGASSGGGGGGSGRLRRMKTYAEMVEDNEMKEETN